jgi:molecular chaperone GrpE
LTRSKTEPSTETLQDEVAEKPDKDTLGKAKEKVDQKESLEERLKAAEEKAEANYESLLRVTADFENYKKRIEREMSDVRKFANESLIKELLPIVDNLERALAIEYGKNKDTFEGIREGVEMTFKELMECLQKFGVTPMDSLEKPFDPNFHHAVSQEESEKYPENMVLKELQKGYMLRDRLLRAPMVVVSKKPDSKVKVKSEEPGDESKIKVTIH